MSKGQYYSTLNFLLKCKLLGQLKTIGTFFTLREGIFARRNFQIYLRENKFHEIYQNSSIRKNFLSNQKIKIPHARKLIPSKFSVSSKKKLK